jgi:hypothetical protein
MVDTTYRGRRAAAIENDALRVTVLFEGGHIAEILDKATGVNPLWTPPWTSIDPSQYDRARYPEYGGGIDARLLAGIVGHNLCLDVFGAPSDEEFAAGVGVHGESSVAPYEISGGGALLAMRSTFPLAGLAFERTVELHGRSVRIAESVTNLGATDRPIAWTQHVSLGPPFLAPGRTQFRASAGRSKVFEGQFGADDYLTPGAEFEWPIAGGADLRTFSGAPRSSAYTAHRMDGAGERAFFTAWSPEHRLAFGYSWKAADFPWMGIWEENRSRTHAPWNGVTIARGMEFGVSPMPESRRAMIDRGRMFGAPVYRWLPAKATASVEYWAGTAPADAIPEDMDWAGDRSVV